MSERERERDREIREEKEKNMITTSGYKFVLYLKLLSTIYVYNLFTLPCDDAVVGIDIVNLGRDSPFPLSML